MRLPRRTTVLAAALLTGALIAPAGAAADPSRQAPTRHVLLLSIDGLHQADLDWYVANFPQSTLAALVHRGEEFTQASTPVPSDSFPGMIAQATGKTRRPPACTTTLAQTGQSTDKPFTASGLAEVFAGTAAAKYFGVPGGDPRVPDVFGIAQHGVIYTGGKSKIAEHGGIDPQDRNVPIVLTGAGITDAGHSIFKPVETTQIAPTILRLLGLDPAELQAVQREHTPTLMN